MKPLFAVSMTLEVGSTRAHACSDGHLANRNGRVNHSVNGDFFGCADVAGEGADHSTRGRVRSPFQLNGCGLVLSCALLWAFCGQALAAEAPLAFNDPAPKRYELTARASQIDPRAKPHPEIEFVFEKDGKPADLQHASVDTRVP